jgi:hypothetical protein
MKLKQGQKPCFYIFRLDVRNTSARLTSQVAKSYGAATIGQTTGYNKNLEKGEAHGKTTLRLGLLAGRNLHRSGVDLSRVTGLQHGSSAHGRFWRQCRVLCKLFPWRRIVFLAVDRQLVPECESVEVRSSCEKSGRSTEMGLVHRRTNRQLGGRATFWLASRCAARCETYLPFTSFHRNANSSAVSFMACVIETPELWPLIVW